jgi:predicted dehydrogenase
MGISRRNFIYSTGTLAACSCLAPSLSLSSCHRTGKEEHVRMGYIGPEEHFRYYRPMLQKLKDTKVDRISLEEALPSDLHAIFIDSHPPSKPAQVLLLLEENKDIITPYPLASDLYGYNRIQESLVHYGRILGMLNPLYFYPAVRTLKDWLAEETREPSEIRVSCHPFELVRGYHVSGYAGAVQPLQRMISFITGKFPFSLFVEKHGTNEIRQWILDYGSFQATLRVDPGQTGWILELDGPQLNATADHTGLLRLNNEVEPRLSPAPSVWQASMIKNLEDFIKAVRSRTEPAVNSLDGLSAILLNQAAEKSIHQGTRVDL